MSGKRKTVLVVLAATGTFCIDASHGQSDEHVTSSPGLWDIACHPTDSLALVALYDATDGPNWTTRGDWLKPDTWAGTWYGVEFVNETGSNRVGRIKLPSNNLAGIIPTEIGNLDSLTYLNLSNNALVQIPTTIGNLSKLNRLDVSANLLLSIPEQVYSLEALEWANFGSNLLSGPVPERFSEMPNLKYLLLGGNGFESGIPPTYGSFPKLEVLSIVGSELTGTLPRELMELRTLRWLQLGQNRLTGNIPSEIGGLTGLQHLDLAWNVFTGAIPAELGSLQNLELLRITENVLTGPIPDQIGDLVKLTHLDLSGNLLTGEIPGSLGSLENLVVLNLSRNDLSGSIPGEIGSLKKLYELNLDRNELTGGVPPELNSMDALVIAYLSNNGLEGFLPDLSGPELLQLSLQHNNLSNPNAEKHGIWELNDLPPKLQSLDLSFNNFTGHLYVPTDPYLTHLRLTNNYLRGLRTRGDSRVEFLDVRNNVLDFSGILAPTTWSTPPNPYFYAPQDSIPGLPRYVAGTAGESIRITAPEDYREMSEIDHKWLLNGTEIPNATRRDLTIGPINEASSGDIYVHEAQTNRFPGLSLVSTATRLKVLDSKVSQSGWVIALEVNDPGLCSWVGRDGRGVAIEPGHVLLPGDRIFLLSCGKVRLAVGALGEVSLVGISEARIGELLKRAEAIDAAAWLLGKGRLDISDAGSGASKTGRASPRHTVTTPLGHITSNGGYLSIAHDSTSSTTSITVTNGAASVVFDTTAYFSKSFRTAALDSSAISAWETVLITESGIQSVENYSISSLRISADSTYVVTNEDWKFSAVGTDDAGIGATVRANWTAGGGTIDADGYFVSGEIPGTYSVTAVEPNSGLETTAVVIVEDRTSVAVEGEQPPTCFEISSPYPNPFHVATTIPFSVDRAGPARLVVYDLLGRRISTVFDEVVPMGRHDVVWEGHSSNGSDLSSGLYLLVLDSDSGRRTGKVLLVR